MEIKCNNPSCEKTINIDKAHITRIHKESDCKLYFCSDNCDISHKFMFDRNERKYFHSIADSWKKPIEKNFRKFYDFMPESFFDFMKPPPEKKLIQKFPNIYTILNEIEFEKMCETNFPNEDKFLSQNGVFNIIQKFYRNVLDRNKESWDEKLEKQC